MRSAAFLDRDGTLNVEVRYLHRIDDLRWIPGAREAVRRLNDARILVIVVTNQAGVARGFYTEADVLALHAHMQADLAKVGAHVDAFYYSPYHPDGVVPEYRRSSACRKPGDAMYRQAIAEWHIDPSRSFAVGDRASDQIPASQLGCNTYLVETGYGARERATSPEGTWHVPSLVEAVDHFCLQQSS